MVTPSKSPSRWPAVLLLVLLQALVFGRFIPGLGFYIDDWAFLERMSRSGVSFRSLIELTRTGDMARPLDYFYFLFLYKVGGMDPFAYNLIMQGFQALEAALLFLFLDRLLGWRRLALTAACLVMVIPNRDASRVWFVNSVQMVSHGATLWGLLCHLRWIQSRRWGWLAGSLALYLASMLLYESCVFMPALLGGALLYKRMAAGESFAACARRTLGDLVPFAAPFLLGLSWQWVVLPLIGSANPKTGLIGLSPAHAARVYLAGGLSQTGALFWLFIATARGAWKELGALWALFCCFLGAATGAAVWRSAGPEPKDVRPRLAMAVSAAVAGFVGAYLPYALSRGYVPSVAGIVSRTNGTGTWAGALLMGAALCDLSRRRPRLAAAALAGLVAAFSWMDAYAMRQYQRSWRLQQDILAKAAPLVAELPQGATVLLGGFSSYLRMAIVFDAAWDFSSALRLKTGRKDFQGTVVTTRVRFEPGAVVEETGGAPTRRPYDRLFLFDFGRGTLERVTGPLKRAPPFQTADRFTLAPWWFDVL